MIQWAKDRFFIQKQQRANRDVAREVYQAMLAFGYEVDHDPTGEINEEDNFNTMLNKLEAAIVRHPSEMSISHWGIFNC